MNLTDKRSLDDFLSYERGNTFKEQAVDKQSYALQEQIDELRRMSTANKILATAQQKTIDLLSERLDNVLGAIVIAGEETRQ